jgi:hypothetical protein
MATIKVDFAELGSARFIHLQTLSGLTREAAIGTLVLFWAETERRLLEAGDAEEIQTCLPNAGRPESAELFRALLTTGYVERCGDTFLIPRHKGLQARKARRLEISRNALAAREARRKAPPKAPRKSTAMASPVSVGDAWEAYRSAYFERFGADPARNAKSNGLLKDIILRIGKEDAPHVLRFYLSHPDKFYLTRMFPLDLAKRDCEALHTQWRRGRVMTGAAASQVQQAMTYEQEQAEIMAGRL